MLKEILICSDAVAPKPKHTGPVMICGPEHMTAMLSYI